MRLKLEKPLTEKDYGKVRTIAKFLWIPKEVDYEIRWFESVLIEQVVDFDLIMDRDCNNIYYKKFFWKDKKWVNPPINLR